MSLKDLKEKLKTNKTEEAGKIMSEGPNEKKHKQLGLEVKLPGMEDFKPLGKGQYNQIYADDIGPRLLTIIDECAELLEPSGVKTSEGKEEDAMKQEITMLIKSITQLGRSSGMHLVIAPLSIDTIIPLCNGKFKTMLTIKPGDFVYDSNMSPTKVLSLSEVKESKTLYKIRLTNSENVDKEVIIKADEAHRFPVFNENSGKIEILTTDEIYRLTNMGTMDKIKFVGVKNKKFNILSIEIIENELVRCIEIDSENHLFVIVGCVESDIICNKEGEIVYIGNKRKLKEIDTCNLKPLEFEFNENGQLIIKRDLNYNYRCNRNNIVVHNVTNIEKSQNVMDDVDLKSVGELDLKSKKVGNIEQSEGVDDNKSCINLNDVRCGFDDKMQQNMECKIREREDNDSTCSDCVGQLRYLKPTKHLFDFVITHNTQRNDASIIPGVIQNNPLGTNTTLPVLRNDGNDGNDDNNGNK